MRTEIRVVKRSREVKPRTMIEKGEHRMQGRPVDDRPHSVYEIVTRRMLEEVREDVSEVKGRANALLWMVAGAVVLEVVMKLIG